MARIIGTSFKDDIFAEPSGSIIQGLGAGDMLFGREGDDVLFGGEGNDVLVDTYGGADRLYGGAGIDSIQLIRGFGPPAGAALVDGGADDDFIIASDFRSDSFAPFVEARIMGGSGDDEIQAIGIAGLIEGGSGNDVISVQSSTAAIDAGAGNDRVSVFARDGASGAIDGGSGNDVIQVTTDNADATIRAGDGNDDISLLMQRGLHEGRLDLGAGNDRATAYALTSDVFLSLSGGAGNDTLFAFGFAVEARGGSGSDSIDVEATNAVIDAGSGLDVVTIGSEGDYLVTLGDGPDRLKFDALFTHSPDTFEYVTVTDFRTGNSGDVLDLSGALALSGWTAAQGDPFDTGYARLRASPADGASTSVELSLGDGHWFVEALLIGVSAASLNPYNLDGFGG